MTGRTFLNAFSNGRIDIVQLVLSLPEKTGSSNCVVGGLAVNAYAEPVVSLDMDIVLQGKVWAYSDETRRKSKRQKDLSDIMRLVETYPELEKRLPAEIAAELE